MPPRRSCFELGMPAVEMPLPFNATTAFLLRGQALQGAHGKFTFNATTAFLPSLAFRLAREFLELHFQCHHGVPALIQKERELKERGSLSMLPRRSCRRRAAREFAEDGFTFNATTAFLDHPHPSHHRGQARSLSMPPRRSWRDLHRSRGGDIKFTFNATTAFLPIIPQDEELLSSPGKDLERDKDSWVRTSVGFDGYLTPFRSIRPLGVRGSLFRSPDHSHAMHPRRAIFLAQHRSKARRSVSLQRVIRSPFRGPPIGGFSMGIRGRFLSGVNAGIRPAPAD